MRALPQEVIDELFKNSDIRPCYLIEMKLGVDRKFSTGQEYELNGETYEAGQVQKLRLTQSSAQFGVINDNYAHTTPALNGNYQRAPVKVYWATGFPISPPIVQPGYVADGYYNLDDRPAPVLLFDGNLDQFTQITTVLGVKATRSAVRSYPKLRVLPPLANYVRSEGALIEFGGNVLRLQQK